MAGLVPVGSGQSTDSTTVTIEFEKSGENIQTNPVLSTRLIGRSKFLKGYEQCVGMILVLVISFSTLVALLKDIYEQSHEIISAPLEGDHYDQLNHTILNGTIKAFFID